jgi:hypothetical protein
MVGLVDEIAGQSDAAGGLERRQRPQGAQGGRVGQDAVERGELVGEGARGLRGLAELGRGQGFRRWSAASPSKRWLRAEICAGGAAAVLSAASGPIGAGLASAALTDASSAWLTAAAGAGLGANSRAPNRPTTVPAAMQTKPNTIMNQKLTGRPGRRGA